MVPSLSLLSCESSVSVKKTLIEKIYIYKLFISVSNPAGNYMFKVNNRNTRTTSETCSKLTIKTLCSCFFC